MWIELSEQWWQQLLSGTVGAAVSAGVSVVVALLVVSRSNEHHERVAIEERMLAAKAEALISIERAIFSYHMPPEVVDEVFNRVDDAVTRFRLLVADEEFIRELIFWPNLLRTLARRTKTSPSETRPALIADMQGAAVKFIAAIEFWPDSLPSVLNEERYGLIEKYGLTDLLPS